MIINKRIYFLPTILFIYAVATGLKLAYLLLFYSLITIALMYYLIRRAEENIDVFIYISDQVTTVGKELNIEYKIINLGVLPIPDIKVRFLVSKKLSDVFLNEEEIHLSSYMSHSLNKNIDLKRRGVFSVGKLEITISDYFNFFTKIISIDKNINLKVYPKLINIDEIDLSPKEFFGNVNVDKIAYEDYTSINRIREYANGDSKKNIHWKISAKYDEYYTKVFDLTADTNINVLLNTYKKDFMNDENGQIEENLVSYTISMIKYFLGNKISVELNYFTDRKYQINGKSMKDFGKFLEALTVVEMESEVPLVRLIKDINRKRIFSTSIFIVSNKIDERTSIDIDHLKKKDFDVYVKKIGSGKND